ncbi:MAG: hypothetical protein [Caudoviricetes sp.]|nr:MAG: hypothetical protein [Caudoviricetes sp.]
MTFTLGNEVCCVKENDKLEIGKKYIISKETPSSLGVINPDDDTYVGMFFKSYFQKVIPTSSKKFLLIDKDKLSFVNFNGKECLIIPEELQSQLIYKGDLL